MIDGSRLGTLSMIALNTEGRSSSGNASLRDPRFARHIGVRHEDIMTTSPDVLASMDVMPLGENMAGEVGAFGASTERRCCGIGTAHFGKVQITFKLRLKRIYRREIPCSMFLHYC
jgi:hypothetical protein